MTAPATLGAWIDGRVPPVPDGFRPTVEPSEPDAPASAGGWVREARRALSRVEAHPGAREAAFALLAADGFATWASEMAVDADDPAGALRGVLDALME